MRCQALDIGGRMNKVWHRWSWLFHFMGLVFLAGVAWAGVLSQSGRIDKLEIKSDTAITDIYGIKQDTATIKESLKWIERALGRQK